MEHKSSVLAVITARGGSKGLPNKNLLKVDNKPLIFWTIESALNSSIISKVILSSDDKEIMKIAEHYGCMAPFIRPDNLASDTANSIDVMKHAINYFPDFEYVILLQPTSPLRTSEDIDSAFQLLKKAKAPSCVSICETDQSPYLMYKMKQNNKIESLLPNLKVFRRQELPKTYILNGAIYIAKTKWLLKNNSFIGKKSVGYIMDKKRSIDIDTKQDFELFKSMVKNNQAQTE